MKWNFLHPRVSRGLVRALEPSNLRTDIIRNFHPGRRHVWAITTIDSHSLSQSRSKEFKLNTAKMCETIFQFLFSYHYQ